MKKQLPPIAVALREARAKAGISQRNLAHAAGVSKPTIANIERGVQTSVRMNTLERLAKVLGCELADLIGQDAAMKTDAVGAFLDSPLAKELSVTAKEKAWLTRLRINWDGREPSTASILFLLSAYRHRTQN